jgi:hypothetical protein
MLRFTTASGIVVSTAVLGIAFAAFLASASPPAKAEPQIASVLLLPLAKADRLPERTAGAACSLHGWPYYDPGCRFDLRAPAQEARTVRVIALR